MTAKGVCHELYSAIASKGGAIWDPNTLLITGIDVNHVIWNAETNKMMDPMNIQNSLEVASSSFSTLGMVFKRTKNSTAEPIVKHIR